VKYIREFVLAASWYRWREPLLRLCFCLLFSFATPGQPADEAAAPTFPSRASPRELYNAGTRLLNSGKLREAEAMLENSLASQQEILQPPALYNLGHTRFRQGAAELKKQPEARSLTQRSGQATRLGQAALNEADAALVSNDAARMVAAYLRGRGIRRQLKQAREAVQQALQTYGLALQKWERASGDFHSAAELAPADSEARTNAAIVDRDIAALVDRIVLMQQAMQAMRERQQQLGEKLKDLKGRIPGDELPPEQSGDDDDEEEGDKPQPEGPQQGQKEARGQEGKEMALTPEQAAWLLDGYRLDSERRLPMGQQSQQEPRNPNRAEW
jgi:hypothetical protein